MPYTKGNVPFVGGSDTSEDAAISYEGSRAGDMMRVYKCIASSLDGMTCEEVEHFIDMRHQTASARIRDLFLDNLIFDTGVRRKTSSGRTARVYMAIKRENSGE